MNATDGELLRQYAKDRSEAAFEELVQRHLPLVYSAALRQTNGDVLSAEDVTQLVFVDLARKAGALARHTSLAGWLYTSTRFAASTARRAEQRRTAREREVQTMNALLSSTESEPDWTRIRPLLDEVMHTLEEPDGEAVLLRHFERRSYAEIGELIGLTENAARMRVERALEKLQVALSKRGVTSTSLALAGLLAAEAMGAVPAHLASTVVRAALAGGVAAGGLAALVTQIFAGAKIKVAMVLLVVLAGVILVATYRRTSTPDAREVAAGQNARITGTAAAISETNASGTNPALATSGGFKFTNGPSLRLQIVAADSGLPVPNVPIDYWVWAGGGFFPDQKLHANRFGICEVTYPSNTSRLELTTRIDDFADTRLEWVLQEGDVIPTNYVLRLDRPVPIGGRVVDPDGKPVAGATVGWGIGMAGNDAKQPPNHEFGWMKTQTDTEGRWRINRIAEEMIPRLHGDAEHNSFARSSQVDVGGDKSIEKQIRDGTFVFHLKRGTQVSGIVTDESGTPVSNARVTVGAFEGRDSRSSPTRFDGTFSIENCPVGSQPVSAEADGYAVTTITVDLSTNTQPVRLVLQNGGLLRLRIVDQTGGAVTNAKIYYRYYDAEIVNDKEVFPPQAQFESKTDGEGRVTWSNAPNAELSLEIVAAGFVQVVGVKARPGNEEKVITLLPAVMVHGTVRDADNGQPIRDFRILSGRRDVPPFSGTTNFGWNEGGADRIRNAEGEYLRNMYLHIFGNESTPDAVLRFEADGYAPFVSDAIGVGKSDVHLDVLLHRAATVAVTVYKPDGTVAVWTDVGLVCRGAYLSLLPGGFKRGAQGPRSGGTLLQTGGDGTFQLRPDDQIVQVIAAGADGYASATPDELKASPTLQLQPWGRLEITSLSQGKLARIQACLAFNEWSKDLISFNQQAFQSSTDDNGQMNFPQVPPGRYRLVRLNELRGAEDNWTPVDIQPGEITRLTFGASNHLFTARLRWPAGMQMKPEWNITATLQSKGPPLPPGLETNFEARATYYRSDEYLRSAAYQEYTKNCQTYQLSRDEEDNLTATDVMPGTYVLRVFIGDRRSPTWHAVASVMQTLTIPESDPSTPFDAGTVELQPDSGKP